MKPLFIIFIVIFSFTKNSLAQDSITKIDSVLSFEEYLGYVKKHHPIVKQANLQLSMGEANLLKARGGFDPKIDVDFDRKKFKGTEYYNTLDAAFKIPTWYGIELKANFEENTGTYLDPSLTVPENGLYSAGVSFSLAKGLLINDRMATLKKAKHFLNQTKAERDLLVNELIFEASKAYFKWVEAYNEEQLYKSFLQNSKTRFEGIKRSIEEGDKAAIDSTEARIQFQNRALSFEAAKLKRTKATLVASNYLWIKEVPLLLKENIVPLAPSKVVIETSLSIEETISSGDTIQNHPKIRSLNAKFQALKVDQALKRNNLLPKIDLQYNFLTSEADQVNSFNTANYKAGLNVVFPLFLRKERGELKLTELKLQDTNFERNIVSLTLRNKITAINNEISSLLEQKNLVDNIVAGYRTLLKAEERKFQMGESSLFLVNSREQKLIEASIKAIKTQADYLESNANLYNTLGVSEIN